MHGQANIKFYLFIYLQFSLVLIDLLFETYVMKHKKRGENGRPFFSRSYSLVRLRRKVAKCTENALSVFVCTSEITGKQMNSLL